MTSAYVGKEDEDARPDTPVPSTSSSSKASSSVNIEAPTLASPHGSSADAGASHPRFPVPAVSQSQVSFPDVELVAIDDLPTEIANADISIAPDGSYIETSSGAAARELKRRYDQLWGVNKDVRSPYATTAYVNQHGKQMYRLGFRNALAPAASAVEAENRALSSKSTSPSAPDDSPTRSKRRSRLSMHNILSTNMPRNGTVVTPLIATKTDGNRSRKLRKTRSIPDMFGSTDQVNMSDHPAAEHRQSGITGRAHSHSVTGADMHRLPITVDLQEPPRRDIFGDLMQWGSVSSPYSMTSGSASSSAMSPFSGGSVHNFVRHPFGMGVSFDSPSRRPDSAHLHTPHVLREVQSFESGLTARASPEFRINPQKKSSLDPISSTSNQPSPSSSSSDGHAPRQNSLPPDPGLSPLQETSLHSRYSTDVFDVLQTYRGLPILDRLSPETSETTVIKMSIRADDSAAPRDDPRFVIWGEIQIDREDDLSISQGSRADLASIASPPGLTRRKSSKASKSSGSSVLPSVRVPTEGGETCKVLLAATIERWIAQLTSDLDYDELLIFLLTYRTYISAVDLLHLLICRFHWALSKAVSPQDERVRRIVRVRTFVAIRYWLLTFFAVDFLPNRDLRLLLSDWLNALIRDPILEKHSDGLSIVRKLRKIVKECKEAHTVKDPAGGQQTKAKDRRFSSIRKHPRPHVFGDKFAEAVASDQDEDSDLDLDFVSDEAVVRNNVPMDFSSQANHSMAGPSPISKQANTVSSPVVALLQQPLQQTILQQRNRVVPDLSAHSALVPNPGTLPLPHSAFSRVFVKTLGRLGRWKRVLNAGSVISTPLGACADVSAFDLELNESGDLLTVRGGVERYLRVLEQQSQVSPSPVQVATPKSSVQLPRSSLSSTCPSSVIDEAAHYEETLDIRPEFHRPDSLISVPETVIRQSESVSISRKSSLRRVQSQKTISSSNSSDYGVIVDNPPSEAQGADSWHFDVVSIDDLDLSDTSSGRHMHMEGPAHPPGLRRPPRKLPMRRDFEFVRPSADSVSSMGFGRESYASGMSTSSAVSSSSANQALGGNIQQWQMNALIDSLTDDGQVGDVEDALRRLEGQINPVKLQEKAQKVDGWVRSIQARLAAGDYTHEQPRFLSDEEDELDVDEAWNNSNGNGSVEVPVDPDGEDKVSPVGVDVEDTSREDVTVSTPVAEQGSSDISSLASLSRETKHVVEDAVPIEILQSRLSSSRGPSRPSTSNGLTGAQDAKIQSPVSRFVTPDAPHSHQSFITSYRADLLVQHFAMIDRELFMGVKFEELVSDDWMSCEEVNVLDWVQYLRDRARWKVESRLSQKTSALAAVRARFNVMASFTISEVVLTHPSHRPAVVAKFIRIAWKAYSSSSFNTLVAIVAGLQNEWVTKAMHRLWYRVGMFETRMFNDLKQWTSSADNFKYIRNAIDTIADAKPIVSSHTPSVASAAATDGISSKGRNVSDHKPPVPSACIPFIGVYLSQLHQYSRLPDLVDPTAPNDVVEVDPATGNFSPPAHPEVFLSLTPLPPSMQLEPLINVQKQRLIAGVIKSLVAGQHLASRVQYPVDKRLFQRCLKLRGLDAETLQRVYVNMS